LNSLNNGIDLDISVIIPAYNAEKSIFRCLDSLKNASWGKLSHEILLVNNNCSDDTMLVAEQFDVIVIDEEKQGRSQARNTGARQARGRLLCFLDADVFVESDYFIEVEKVLGRESIGGVQGRIIPSEVDGQHSINKYRYRAVKESTAGTFCLLNLMVSESPMINSAACSYKKDAFDLAGGFDEELERHEDIDLARRVSYCGFLLASAEKAQANVIYHGEGWFSYFLRSFSDGLTKIDYSRKWSRGVDFRGAEGDEQYIKSFDNAQAEPVIQTISTGSMSKTKKSTNQKIGVSTMIKWALRDLIGCLWRFFRHQDIHYVFDFIIQVFRLFGRVIGPIIRKPSESHSSKVIINLCPPEKRLKKVTLENGKVFFLKPSLRFILLLKNPYMIDIEGHAILSYDHEYPYFFPNSILGQLDLFNEFAHDNQQNSKIYQILKYKGLLAEKL